MSHKTYPCPSCKTELVWRNDNEFRPFCSAQCKNQDFIGWANESHIIEGSSVFGDVMSEDLSLAREEQLIAELNEAQSNVHPLKRR